MKNNFIDIISLISFAYRHYKIIFVVRKIFILLIFFQSPVNAETGSAHDETSSSGNKEDEDDDDDESDDKIDTHTHDPERLKAFNVSSYMHEENSGISS